jgi:DNA-binding MarR family transcriptional regulator
MTDSEELTSRFAREHPDLIPVLRAMVSLARDNEAQPESRLGEFCRSWLAAREPGTPRTLGAFEKAGLIRKSPRGVGSSRIFYVLTDRAASVRALAAGTN